MSRPPRPSSSAPSVLRSAPPTIGTLVTSGYTSDLPANVPLGTPEDLVTTVEDPDALVSSQALDALQDATSALPGGEEVVGGLLTASREALSGAISDAFLFVLAASVLGVAGALLMQNLRLKEKESPADPVESPEKAAALVGSAAAAPREPRVRAQDDPRSR